MQQRYYDPIAGRFLSTDPVVTDANTGGSFGRYHYANNNPYRFTDPDGRDAESGSFAQGLSMCQAATGTDCGHRGGGRRVNGEGFNVGDASAGGSQDTSPSAGCDEECEHKRDFVNPSIRANKAGNDAAGALATVTEEAYKASAGGVAIGGAKMAAGVLIQFGKTANQIAHTFRHTNALGLESAAVKAAIGKELQLISAQIAPGKPFNRMIEISGVRVQYTAFKLANGTINIGRIHGTP